MVTDELTALEDGRWSADRIAELALMLSELNFEAATNDPQVALIDAARGHRCPYLLALHAPPTPFVCCGLRRAPGSPWCRVHDRMFTDRRQAKPPAESDDQ